MIGFADTLKVIVITVMLSNPNVGKHQILANNHNAYFIKGSALKRHYLMKTSTLSQSWIIWPIYCVRVLQLGNNLALPQDWWHNGEGSHHKNFQGSKSEETCDQHSLAATVLLNDGEFFFESVKLNTNYWHYLEASFYFYILWWFVSRPHFDKQCTMSSTSTA